VDEDGPGGEVQGKVVQDVAELDLGELTQGSDARKADALGRGPLEHRRGDRIGLGDEGEVARRRHHGRSARVELSPRHDHADPVGPDQAQPVGVRGLAGGTGPLGVEGRRPHPAADQHHRPAAAGGELGQECRQVALGQAHDGQARLGVKPGQPLQAGLRWRSAGAAQRQDPTREAGIPQVGLGDLRPARRLAERADPQDPLGLEQVTQAA
jgi:hypothetical protein